MTRLLFDSLPVVQIVAIPSEEAYLALLDGSGSTIRNTANLIKVRKDGTLIWRAQADSGDSFVNIVSSTGDIKVQTWMGLLVQIDRTTGTIVASQFVK